jgi:hypothetical protein
MLTKYLARRGLRLTFFGECMTSAAGLALMGLAAWALIWVFA